MRQSTQRLCFVGLLGVACAALLVDRAVLGPSSASAAEPVPTASGPASQPTAPTPRVQKPTIATQIDGVHARVLEGSAPRRDAFRLPASMDVAPVAPAEPRAPRSAGFADRHAVTGIMIVRDADGRGVGPASYAVVSGTRVRLGEVLDGHTLVRLDQREATFSDGEREVTLRLAGPADRSSP